MKNKKINRLVVAAMLAALSCIATMAIRIPSQMGGYINLGDSVVLFSAFILGPLLGGFSAGLGSALADIFSGFVYYAPGTFVIKALCAAVAALVYRRTKRGAAGCIVSGVCGEIIMVLGYFAYAGLILSNGLAAASSIPGNLTQAVVGIFLSVLLMRLFSHIKPEEMFR